MTTPREFDKGDLVNCFGTFQNPDDDNYVDPATVTCKVRDPAGNVTTLVYPTDAALVRIDVGKYRAGVDANMSGWWWYRFESTGVSKAAGERSFRVLESKF